MATAEQIKTLIRSHFDTEPERFFTVALQVAAHEASRGHGDFAREIRNMVDRARKERKTPSSFSFLPNFRDWCELKNLRCPSPRWLSRKG